MYSIVMTRDNASASTIAAIDQMAQKYLWWKAVAEEGHSTERMVAQIMRFGSYDDIRRLETLLMPSDLAAVMMGSAPGWFDDRSWDFWRGRLSLLGISDIHEHRPQRTFAHASMF